MTLAPEMLAELGYEIASEDVIIRPMTTANRAIDLYLGEVQRRLRPRTHKTYSRILDQLLDFLPVDEDVAKVTDDQVGRFLDRQLRKARGTQAQYFTCLKCFFDWAVRTEKIKRSPMRNMLAPRRLPAEALDVTTVSTEDVRRLLAAAAGWTEKLSVALPAYMGCRRHAAAQLRVKDYDTQNRTLRFQEKGGKTIWKPVPDELAAMLDARLRQASDGHLAGERFASRNEPDGWRGRAGSQKQPVDPDTESGETARRASAVVEVPPSVSPDDYLIPNQASSRVPNRDDRVVWAAVKRCADRAGVEAHVHALRAAFAVFFLETHGRDAIALQELMGHRNFETTRVYLRKLDRHAAMEQNRDLSWK